MTTPQTVSQPPSSSDASKASTTTEQLVARAAGGESAAFATLAERSAVRLSLFIRRRAAGWTRADSGVEDLLQITLLRAWKLMPEFEARGSQAFTRWLVAIAENVIADRGRYLSAKGRGTAQHFDADGFGADAFAAEATSVAQAASRSEQVELLDRALRSLPDSQQLVVEAHLLQAQSLTEIAARVGIRKNAVWERLQRGLHGLRRALPPGAGPK